MDVSFSAIHFLLAVVLMGPTASRAATNYTALYALFEEKLGRDTYNPQLRPVRNHRTITNVTFKLYLNSIVGIDDIGQSFTADGYLTFIWKDELVTWDPKEYDDLWYLIPKVKQVWRPRMIITNSVAGRDPFAESSEPLTAMYTGDMMWSPSMVIPTTCHIKMDKFPFDTQRCHIQDGFDVAQLPFYIPNKKWSLMSSNIETIDIPVGYNTSISCVRIFFEVKRRPTFFLINIILPSVLMPFLNIFVFAIPVESGEKISYGITVLLALSFFLSMISSMMPDASDSVPAVTIYLFSLLVGSVCSVVVAIGTVALQHRDVKEEKLLKAKSRFRHALKKMTNVRDAIQAMNGDAVDGGISTSLPREESRSETLSNRYRLISKHIDTISFIVFMFLWFAVTVWYFIHVT